jgi:hypothetical protein
MDLVEFNKSLKKVKVNQLAFRTLKGMTKFIADLNREQLAKEGVNDDGEKLEPEYSELTNILKTAYGRGTGSITSHVTLFDKGDLHKSIFATVDDEELILGSFDDKVPELTGKYGEFLGLTKESIEKVKVEFNKRFEAALIKKLPFAL